MKKLTFDVLTRTFSSDFVRQRVFDEDQSHSEEDLDSLAEEHVPDPEYRGPRQGPKKFKEYRYVVVCLR